MAFGIWRNLYQANIQLPLGVFICNTQHHQFVNFPKI